MRFPAAKRMPVVFMTLSLTNAAAALAAPGASPGAAAGRPPVMGPIEPVVPIPRALARRPPPSVRRFAAAVNAAEDPMDSARPMVFEGRLLDAQRRRVTGTYLLNFNFWDSTAGGRLVWSEARYVSVTHGIYSIRFPVTDELRRSGFAPGFKVTVDAPAGTGWLVSQPPYYVQVGSFVEAERAMKLHYDLKSEFGYAVITQAEVEGAKRYQVRVGPFDQRMDAEDIAWWLESTGHEAMIVMADR